MAEDFIKSLLDEGAIKLWHDYRFGHCRDLSGNGNHGTINGNCRFEGDGLRFVDNTGFVMVLHDALLNLTDATFVILKPQQRSHDLSSGAVNLWMLDKLAGGVGVGWFWYLSTNRLLLNDGTVTRWSPLAYHDDERYVASSLAAGGGTAIGYREGLSIGNFSGANTLVTSTHNLRIGNSFPGTIQSIMLISRVLDDAEHAKLCADLVNLSYPTKVWSFGKRNQGSVVGEPDLLAGFDLLPSGVAVPSHDGLFTGTLAGTATRHDSILGNALDMGRTDGQVDLGVGTADIDAMTDSHWVEIWVRPLDVPMTDAVAPIIGSDLILAYSYYIHGGVIHTATTINLAWRNASGYVFVNSNVPPRNKRTHLVYQFNYTDGNAYLYIDGVQYGPIPIGVMLAGGASNWVIGAVGTAAATFDDGFGGLACCPRIGTGVLTPEQVQARYLKGARAIQFQTGFAFQVSPAAEGGVLHQQIGTMDSPLRAGDANFRGVIETDTVNGQLCKALRCTTGGIVYVKASDFFDTSETEAAFGTWEWWFSKSELSNLEVNFIGDTPGWADPASDGYNIAITNVERLSLMYTVAGVTNRRFSSVTPYVAVDTWHKMTVTRSSAGVFSVYMDNTLVPADWGTNPVTDAITTVSAYWGFDMGVGDKICLGDVRGDGGIVKMLGVVAP